MNRQEAIRIGNETMEILKKGEYQNREGKAVFIQKELNESILYSQLYTPKETDLLLEQIRGSKHCQTIIEVTKETTLEASKRLIEEGYQEVACLNFASAKNPGGGFLTGSRAQEESIARSSGLYLTIVQMKEMYEHNRAIGTGLYSDYMIFSPKVPVFRNDKGNLLDLPYLVSVITCPAVNAGVIREREKHNLAQIDDVMMKRIKKILAVAMVQNQESLVLGAFGCGVFKNNPVSVAHYFRKALEDERFKHQFKKIVFAIYEPYPKKVIYPIFKKYFKDDRRKI